MTRWAASIHQTGAGLRVRFDRPLQAFELTVSAARELASALLLAAAEAERITSSDVEQENSPNGIGKNKPNALGCVNGCDRQAELAGLCEACVHG